MKNNPDKDNTNKRSDLFIRLRSGLIYAIIVLLGSLLGNLATTIMLSFAAGISAYEFFLVLRKDAKLPNEALGIIAAVSCPWSYYFLGFKGVIFVMLILLLTLTFWYVFWRHARIMDVCISFFGVFYTGVLLTCLLALRMAVPAEELWGGLFVIFLLTSVSVNDGFAYLFGKAFGKHRLAPHISPKKTWEGFLPALFFSTALWFVLLFFPGVKIQIWQCVVFGLLCGISGVIGDLVESRIKRNSGVKDSGHLMPGHGGLLDRLDSIFLVSLTSAVLLFGFNCLPI